MVFLLPLASPLLVSPGETLASPGETRRTSGSPSSCCYQFSTPPRPKGLQASYTCSCNKWRPRQSGCLTPMPFPISIASPRASRHGNARQYPHLTPDSNRYQGLTRYRNACLPPSCIISGKTSANKLPDSTKPSNDAFPCVRRSCSR